MCGLRAYCNHPVKHESCDMSDHGVHVSSVGCGDVEAGSQSLATSLSPCSVLTPRPDHPKALLRSKPALEQPRFSENFKDTQSAARLAKWLEDSGVLAVHHE